jgi:replicative DNA helicase
MITPPLYNHEAEQSVLGGLLLTNEALDYIADIINKEDFHAPQHKIIFSAINTLASQNKPIDFITLSAELKRTNELSNIGGDIYLAELLSATPTSANIRAYANIVKTFSVKRKLLKATQNIVDMVYQDDDKDLVGNAQKLILSVDENKASEPKLEMEYSDSCLKKIIDAYHSGDNSIYLKTGFDNLDRLIGGLEMNSYVIIAARPSMGKTALTVNIAENIAAQGKSVLIFSIETTADSLQYRKLSRQTHIKLERIKNPKSLSQDEIEKIINATNESKNLKIAIDDIDSLSVIDIRAKARRLKNKRGLDLIIIDYVQLIRATEGDNEITKLSCISRDLRALAKELNVCVLILSQLNRNIESRADKRPLMSDLKQSGSLEQDANLIIFIDRPERYDDNAEKNLANIYVEKNKDGRIGKIQLMFNGDICTFSDYISTGYSVPRSYEYVSRNFDLN